MKVIIVGASGKIGSRVAERLAGKRMPSRHLLHPDNVGAAGVADQNAGGDHHSVLFFDQALAFQYSKQIG